MRFNDDERSLQMLRLIWGVSYIQVDRWIEGRDLESRLEVKAQGGCGFGAVASGLEVRSCGHLCR